MAKILVIASSVSPHSLTRGVIGQQVGHQIYWVSTPKVNLPGVTAFGPPSYTGILGYKLLEPIALMRAILHVKPNLIHVHSARQGLRAPVLLSHNYPMIVSTMGGDILADQSYVGIHKWGVRALLDRAVLITSKSEFLDGVLLGIGDYRAKIRRVTWGIDLNHFRPKSNAHGLRKQWSIPPDDLVFLDSRLAKPLYNKDIILKAFARYLQAGGPSATLLISEFLPNKTYLAQLRQQVQELDIANRVRFIGVVDHAAMPDYYSLADLTISIPSSDGVPQTVVEAFACGSFPIVGSLPQYIGIVEDGVTALLVPPRSSEALANALMRAATEPKLRIRAAQLGRAYVEQHADQCKQANLVNKIYVELLETYSK